MRRALCTRNTCNPSSQLYIRKTYVRRYMRVYNCIRSSGGSFSNAPNPSRHFHMRVYDIRACNILHTTARRVAKIVVL